MVALIQITYLIVAVILYLKGESELAYMSLIFGYLIGIEDKIKKIEGKMK